MKQFLQTVLGLQRPHRDPRSSQPNGQGPHERRDEATVSTVVMAAGEFETVTLRWPAKSDRTVAAVV